VKNTFRLPAQLGVTVVLAAALSFATPVFIHRNEYSSSVVNYTRNASPENEATLKAESAKNQQVVLKTHLWGAVFLFLTMNLGWFLVQRWPAKSSDTL
jgi:hypothetical protein